MSTTQKAPVTEPGTPERRVDKAQYGLAAFIAAVGAYTIYDATTLAAAFSDQPVQPHSFPYVIGGALLVLAGFLALATSRGDVPPGEEGEDIDLTEPADWQTVGKLVLVFVLNIALIDVLGWAITGALLFAGTAFVLGSRRIWLNLVIGTLLSVGTWYGFYVGLGVPIPAGILDGVL